MTESLIALMDLMKVDVVQEVDFLGIFKCFIVFLDLCSADRAGCQYKCHNSPDGPICSCPLGEQLVNKTRCEPENECLDPRSW